MRKLVNCVEHIHVTIYTVQLRGSVITLEILPTKTQCGLYVVCAVSQQYIHKTHPNITYIDTQ